MLRERSCRKHKRTSAHILDFTTEGLGFSTEYRRAPLAFRLAKSVSILRGQNRPAAARVMSGADVTFKARPHCIWFIDIYLLTTSSFTTTQALSWKPIGSGSVFTTGKEVKYSRMLTQISVQAIDHRTTSFV
jgi:hypothetical protein